LREQAGPVELQRITYEHARIGFGLSDGAAAEQLRQMTKRFGHGSA
jgi:hypothetical protein